jgi:hypothetical protein
MPNYQSGPVNIQQGNVANFVVEYFDAAGIYTQPFSGSVTVAYTNTSNSAVVDTVTLALTNRYFTGAWSSSGAALGLATWEVFANGTTVVAQTGQMRIIDRQV